MQGLDEKPETLISEEWWNFRSSVFAHLRGMISDGWEVSQKHEGLIRGSYVARPICRESEDTYSGVAIYQIH